MIRSNPYEVAFEEYLRERQTAYVPVDEQRRALLAGASLKSMDFIVYAAGSENLLVDVKGRKRSPGRKWENWATVDDIEALTQWQQVFGADFRSLLVFAYEMSDVELSSARTEHSQIIHDNRLYSFYGVWLDQYRAAMQQRSPRWQTVWLPARIYRNCRFPIGTLFPSTTQSL